MSPLLHLKVEAWECPTLLTLALLTAAVVYVRGSLRLRSTPSEALPGWRAGSYLVGVLLVWVAAASPLAWCDEQLLTVHMAQHLLLMTFAPPLIWLGAPALPWLHGLPTSVVSVLAAAMAKPLVRAAGLALARPAV